MSMMVEVFTLAKYRSMAKPVLIVCVLTLVISTPSHLVPMECVAVLMWLQIWVEVMYFTDLEALSHTVLTGVESVAPGYDLILVMTVPHALTGHAFLSPVWCWVIVHILSPFVWSMKVTEME